MQSRSEPSGIFGISGRVSWFILLPILVLGLMSIFGNASLSSEDSPKPPERTTSSTNAPSDPSNAQPTDPSPQPSPARDLMAAMLERHRLPSEKENLTLTLISAKGKRKERTLTRNAMTTADGLSRTMAVVTGPEMVKGTGILVVEKPGGAVDQWLYLPALKATRKISSGGGKATFMGSDFAHEDMRPERLDAHLYTLLEEADLDGQPCHRIEAVLRPEGAIRGSAYTKRNIWIRKDILFAAKVEYFDKRGELIKTLNTRKLVQVSDGIWRSDELVMSNHKNGHQTTLQVMTRDLKADIKEDDFTLENLKSPGE